MGFGNLSNCKKCGALFAKKNRDICDKCFNEENKNIEDAVSYVLRCPQQKVDLAEICEHINIDIKEGEEYLKKGRWVRIQSRIVLHCKTCGTELSAIEKSLLCKKCKTQMEENIDKSVVEELKNPTVKLKHFDKDIMHTQKSNSNSRFGFKNDYNF